VFGTALIFLAAVFYSSVGHAGASGYLAVMALIGVAPAEMRPAALALNLIVATIGSRNFIKAGHLRWPLLWPFLLASVPMAYLGGRLALPVAAYRLVVGIVLLLSAVRFAVTLRAPDTARGAPPVPVSLVTGGALGFLAGLTGVGGGIFLSPLLLLLGWATLRTTAATSVVFILANSIAGLLGQMQSIVGWPPDLLWWALAVLLGGSIGSYLGARRLPSPALRGLLAVVLFIAGLKLIAA
jgi:uncharacterized membrane protein YfcA